MVSQQFRKSDFPALFGAFQRILMSVVCNLVFENYSIFLLLEVVNFIIKETIKKDLLGTQQIHESNVFFP